MVHDLPALAIGPLEVIQVQAHPAPPPLGRRRARHLQEQLERAFGSEQAALIGGQVGSRCGQWPLGEDGGKAGGVRIEPSAGGLRVAQVGAERLRDGA